MKSTLYAALASMADAYKRRPDLWFNRITETAKNHLPSGSGFDTGTQVDLDKSSGTQLVLVTSFHHMNDAGYYDGWTEHVVRVKPHLVFGFTLTVIGPNRNDIKDLILDTMADALRQEVEL